MKKSFLLTSIISTFLIPQICFSQNPPGSGLSLEVTAGTIFIYNSSNLNPGGSTRAISSLESTPKLQLTTLPILFPEVKYRFGDNNQFSWYFNTNPPIDEAGNFALSSGLIHNLPGLGSFDMSVFFVPFAEAWKNPYLLNESRQETDVTTWGAQFAVNRILGSEFKLKVAYLSEDVSDDDLALLFPELARDGQIFNLTLSYSFINESTFSIRPQLHLRKGEYDGESNSFVKVKAEISGHYMTGRYFLMPSIYYSYKEHDEKDPVFDSTRSENGYGLNLVAKYGGLFDIQSLGLLAIAGYSRGEANESFYNTKSLVCGLSLVYQF